MNKVFLSGNISTDIELKQTSGGAPVSKFNLAVGRMKDGTDFVPIVAWNQIAENVKEFCQKGSRIIVEGRLQINDYEKEGKKQYYTEVVANRVEFDNKNPYKEIKEKTLVSKQMEIKDEDLPWN